MFLILFRVGIERTNNNNRCRCQEVYSFDFLTRLGEEGHI